MTQSSRPQADNVATFPTSDAGPYSADQWAELFQVLFTGDQEATQGPLANYLNELEPTTVGGDILVDTGAGFCYGHWLVNSASVTFSPTHAAREDRVVLVENNTNATYATNLEFPTVLADYNGTASIEPYSCRLAILTGTGAGAPRPLVNAGGINMVLLAHYDIDGTGAVTGLVDDRDFCYFSSTVGSRNLFVPASRTEDETTSAALLWAEEGHEMLDSRVSKATGDFIVPTDFKSGLTIEAIVRPNGAGDVYCRSNGGYAECAEVWTTHTYTSGYQAITVAAGVPNSCIQSQSLGSAVIGDIVTCSFYRDATDILDTIGDIVYLVGFLVTYVAKS
jgi:hypothetical protein